MRLHSVAFVMGSVASHLYSRFTERTFVPHCRSQDSEYQEALDADRRLREAREAEERETQRAQEQAVLQVTMLCTILYVVAAVAIAVHSSPQARVGGRLYA